MIEKCLDCGWRKITEEDSRCRQVYDEKVLGPKIVENIETVPAWCPFEFAGAKDDK